MVTSKQQAEQEARAIFYKIEGLVFDAVRAELKDELEALIRHHFAQKRPLAPQDAKQPRNENRTATLTSGETSEAVPVAEEGDDYAAIRHIITDYVRQSIEDQAPAIVAQTLAHALKAETVTTKKPS